MPEIPQPYHEWRANLDWDVKAFSMKDRCTICNVARYDPMSGERAERSNAVAAGPCPKHNHRDLTDAELTPYLAAWREEEPSTSA